MRALVPSLDVRSMGVLSRIAMRTHLFNAMEVGWASRPSVQVQDDPRAWWRHALQMVLRECRKVRRRRMTIAAASRKRKLRQKYQALYRRLHQSSVHFTDPDRQCAPTTSTCILHPSVSVDYTVVVGTCVGIMRRVCLCLWPYLMFICIWP